MDRPTDQLVQRMLAAVLERFGGEDAIDRLVSRARDEAEAEVRELLKDAIKATLLQRAVSRLESHLPEVEPAAAEFAAKGEPGSETACYVYGITRAAASNVPLDTPSVDPTAPLKRVRHDDLVALTSEVSLADFGADAVAERVKDLDWVERKVRAHDVVVKAMLAAGPVIPCRFCTIVPGADDVRRVLERNHGGLSETLDSLGGKKEWGVKIYAAGGVASQDRQFASGKSYFLEKKREQASRTESSRAQRAAAEACHAELSAAASDSARLRTPDPGEIVVSAAYLVANVDADRFQALVNDLSRRYVSEGLSFELTGPWPPYNFVSLDLSLGPRAETAPAEEAHAGPEAAA